MAHSGKTITFATDLLPNEDNIYNLGTDSKRWIIHGNLTGTTNLLGGLEVKGHIAGDASGTTGHGLYSGGGYHNAYNNIILHGDATTGSSGIAFVSDKVAANGTITNINAPSDRAFIQYHACGVTTATAENTNPTLATSGEKGILVIGIGNDGAGTSEDRLWLQSPGHTGILHRSGTDLWVIPDTGNTTGTVGSTSIPAYVDAGVIKTCSTYAGGTAITLNGTSKGGTTASFYASTSVGTAGQVLKSQGSGEPEWANEYSVEILDIRPST